MSGSTKRLILSTALAAEIERHARAAFPRECCGLLEGVTVDGAIEIRAVHAARNLATEFDRFEIDPADQFRLLREARERGTDIVGCYHSHPNGACEPSQHDASFAVEDGFVWLIAALSSASAPISLGAFVFEGGVFQVLPRLAPSAGAAL